MEGRLKTILYLAGENRFADEYMMCYLQNNNNIWKKETPFVCIENSNRSQMSQALQNDWR